MAAELTTDAPRKLKGRDPLLFARAPAPLIELIRAKASERKVAVSVVIREALAQYVGEVRDRAA